MIRAMLFDLDGVLVQTEKMKAHSYALAVQHLLGLPEPAAEAGEAYRETVGAPRKVAVSHVMDKLGLEEVLKPLMGQYGASEPWEVLNSMRMSIYTDMVADPQVLRDNQWPHSMEVLRAVREVGCLTALVTMSQRRDVLHVVHSLGVEQLLDLVLTGEDVTRGKPDPEVYLLAARKLGVSPEESLVLEDTVNGVRAAVAAGMNVVALATPFTSAALRSSPMVDDAWIVDDFEKLGEIVQRRIRELNRTAC
jgi:HAD superfamily hydrolase (TIGR01509 family)